MKETLYYVTKLHIVTGARKIVAGPWTDDAPAKRVAKEYQKLADANYANTHDYFVSDEQGNPLLHQKRGGR